MFEEDDQDLQARFVDEVDDDIGGENVTEEEVLQAALADAEIDEDELLEEIREQLAKGYGKEKEDESAEKEKEENKMTPIELKTTMIFAAP